MKPKHLLMMLFAVALSTTFAQPFQQQRKIGGNGGDYCESIYLTKDGGLIAGGSSYSEIFRDKTEACRGYLDYWLVKLDNLGNIQWDKTIGGGRYDHLKSVQQTSDGGYILGGYSDSDSSDEKTQNHRGNYDYWVVKLDSERNIEWDKTIGGGREDNLNCLQQTTDGGYILGGHSRSNISGEKTENSRGGYDYWIVKLDSKGNIQWNKTIGGNNNEGLFTLQQTSDGGYILGGYSDSDKSFEKTENSRGYSDYWLVKLNKSGNIQWDKTIGGDNTDWMYSLEQTRDHGYILGGYSQSGISGEKTENSREESVLGGDYWIVKLDSLRNIQWDKTIGGNDEDKLHSLLQTSDGGYILGGSSNSNASYEKTEKNRGPNYTRDYWVVKLNSTGKIQWDKTIGGSGNDELYSIKETRVNHYVLGGFSEEWPIDYWLVEIGNRKDGALEVTDREANNIKTSENNNTKTFSVYPNPAKDILHIQTNGKATFTLTNQSGKILLTKTITNKGEINVAHLSAGFYYLKNNTTGVVQKVVISK